MLNRQKNKMSIKKTAVLAMQVALSIILGKYLALPVGDVMRFSFENLPIIFTGIVFGPISAAMVGLCADLVGCILVGFTPIPLVAIGAVAIGVISGLLPRLLSRFFNSRAASVIITVAAAHIIGSVIIKTFGLSSFYDMPFHLLMLWRLLNYLIVGAAESVLLIIILKNQGIQNQIDKMR